MYTYPGVYIYICVLLVLLVFGLLFFMWAGMQVSCLCCLCLFWCFSLGWHAGACRCMHYCVCVFCCFWFCLCTHGSCWYLCMYMCVLCSVSCFFVRVCLLVDASVVCVLKMLLFLLLLFCFFMCVPISIWSCVHICGWDRVVLGVCMFGAGADIQLVASGC